MSGQSLMEWVLGEKDDVEEHPYCRGGKRKRSPQREELAGEVGESP